MSNLHVSGHPFRSSTVVECKTNVRRRGKMYSVIKKLTTKVNLHSLYGRKEKKRICGYAFIWEAINVLSATPDAT